MKYPLVSGILFLLSGICWGQQNTIQRAMKDELNRSMAELREDSLAPFYISYTLRDGQYFRAGYSMGALIQKEHSPSRSKSLRVIVGDYEFNDESLDQNSANPGEYLDVTSLFYDWNVPRGDDYTGIRRSFWSSTDKVFRDAVKAYLANKRYVEGSDKPLSEIPHRHFGRVPVVTLTATAGVTGLKTDKSVQLGRDASAFLTDFPEVEYSGVAVNISDETFYFLSSEGTDIATRKQLYNISVFLRVNKSIDALQYYATDENRLPTPDQIKSDIKRVVERLSAPDSTEVMDEPYDGPVLFTGKSIALMFSGILGEFRTSDLEPQHEGMYQMRQNTRRMEDKLGKNVISENLSIMLTPKLTEYEGTTLISAYQADSEGVIPADTISLVRRGTLEGLMSCRTIIDDSQTPNGTCDGPGVAVITSEHTMPFEALKSRLLELAEEDGLDHAYIVTSYNQNNELAVVRVSLDGTEVNMRATLNDFSLRSLRKVAGSSSSMMVSNDFGSIISPDAILLEDIDLTPIYYTLPPEEEAVVSSPLTLE